MKRRAWPLLLPRLLLNLLFEIPFFLVLVLLRVLMWPFDALDYRRGWTLRGRRRRAEAELRHGSVTPLEQAPPGARVVVEGRLETAGTPVTVPIVGVEALAWEVVASVDGSPPVGMRIDGASTTVELVDSTGRARLESIEARGWPYSEYRRLTSVEVLPEWLARADAATVGWTLHWLSAGTTARASGTLARGAPDAPHRSPATMLLGPGSDGVPLLVRSVEPPRG